MLQADATIYGSRVQLLRGGGLGRGFAWHDTAVPVGGNWRSHMQVLTGAQPSSTVVGIALQLSPSPDSRGLTNVSQVPLLDIAIDLSATPPLLRVFGASRTKIVVEFARVPLHNLGPQVDVDLEVESQQVHILSVCLVCSPCQ